MKFKLNGFEKFIIKNHKVMRVIALIPYAISVCLSSYYDVFGEIAFIVTLIALFYIAMLPQLKNIKLVKLNNVEMDLYEFINGSNMMIEATNPKDVQNITTFCISRIIALINMGEFDRAENELRLFWQSFDLKKIPANVLADTHIAMANIMLEKGDMKSFNDQMNLVYQYQKNAQGFAILKNTLNHNINGIHLFAEAVTADENRNENDYEARVLEHLNTNPINNKPRKKQAQPMYFVSAYNKLFNFFKRTGNTQKATYYAQQILNIGNEQLIDYRRAKEYLENENSSN